MKYHSRDYRVVLSKLSEEEGGGYIALIPELDCHGDGDTPEVAMNDAYEVAEEILKLAIEDGISIPAPKEYRSEDDYSGKFTVRIPKILHKRLTEEAEADGCSLNTLVASYLSYGLGKDSSSSQTYVQLQKRHTVDFQKILSSTPSMWKEGSPKEDIARIFERTSKQGVYYVNR